MLYLIRTGEKGPGGSTITMQVARNFFLTREKTYIRKLNEILEFYVNKIFLGRRACGVGAAALLPMRLDPPRLTNIAAAFATS